MATKIINSKTNNYESERDQEVVVEEYSPRSFLYSLRAGAGSQIDNIRQTVIINLDENGQSDVKNINLGNYGDNEILYIQVNSSSIEHDSEQYANYNPILFIHKNGITEHIEASERGEGWSAFLVKQSNFTSAGNYELMFGLIETELDTGNLADEYEIFLSNTIIGTVADTRIHGAYYEELDNASVIDEDYHNFIHKQPIVLSLADNRLVITSAPVNINKGDRYSAYIELLGASEQLDEYFLVGSINDQYCFYKFTQDEDNTYKTWIPEEWTATDERYNVWIVGRSGSKRYVSELFNFQANKTFLDQGYFDDEVMGTSTGEQVVSISDQKLTLINTSNLGGVYKLQYTGEEVQSLLDYVKNNVINQIYSKTEIDGKFAVVDGNISHISTSISGINNQINTITTKTSTLESGLSTVNGAITQINTNIIGVNSQINTLTTKTNELEDELTTVSQSVQCSHRYEITGNTGDEHGLAIDDQQMLLDRVQGRTLVKNQINNSGKTFTISSTTAAAYGSLKWEYQKIYRGHKYYAAFDVEYDSTDNILFKLDNPAYSNFFIMIKGKGHYSKIDVVGNNGSLIHRWSFNNYYDSEHTFGDITIKNLQIIDLTQKYGAGNEPTTVEQVLNDMQGYEEYDLGSFIHSKNNLISTGRNIWDEEWEIGYFNSSGNAEAYDNAIRSINYIPVIPNIIYYVKGENIVITKYDINKKPLGYILWGVSNNGFVIPADTYYIRVAKQNVKTYNNDICINVSDESFNGTYEPYQEDVMVVDRDLKALEYIDNITNEKVNKGAFVDMGTLTYVAGTDGNGVQHYRLSGFPSNFKGTRNAISTRYIVLQQTTAGQNMPDLSLEIRSANEVYLRDLAYTTVEAIKSALSGVMLYYETTTETREPLQLPRGMAVWNNGMQIQKGTIPYLLTKTYSLSIAAQVKANIAIDKEQQDQINKLKTEHKELREDFDSAFSNSNVKRETSALIDYPSKELSYPNQQVTVDEVRGRSLVVNQLAQPTSWSAYNGSLTNVNNSNTETSATIISDSSTYLYTYGVFQSVNYILNHKYLFKVDVAEESITNLAIEFGGTYYGTLNKGTNAITVTISQALNSDYLLIYPRTLPTVDSKFTMKNIEFIDLTAMYGAGNEPTDINQVLIDIDKFKVDGVLPYNLGELKDVEFSRVKSVGVNIWDEEWEVGAINYETGIDEYETRVIRSKGYTKVTPNTTYHFRCDRSNRGYFKVRFYDINKNYLGGGNPSEPELTYTSPENACYIRFAMSDTYGTTYNHDICINISNNDINGQYFPYEEDNYEIPQVDLKSAGVVYDSLHPSKGKVVQRVGVVDLGTLDYVATEENGIIYFNALSPNDSANITTNGIPCICSKYLAKQVYYSQMNDKELVMNTSFSSAKKIVIRDSSYTDVATFKAAMSGVFLYYELAEPIESDITCSNNYKAWQFGTEMQLGNFPTTIVKDYSISILDQITKNVEVDRNQSDSIEQHNARLQTIENILANLKLAEGESF